MPNNVQIRHELEAERAGLKPLYLAAKKQGDTAEMERLVNLAAEIDDLLDDLVFIEYSKLASRLAEIAKKISAAKKRAEDPIILIPPILGGQDSDAENENSDNDDNAAGMLIPGRSTIQLDPSGEIATGQNGLKIIYKGTDTCPYGKTATNNKKPFVAMVIHHTANSHNAEWYVKYQLDGDAARGGHFGYHFYIAKNGTIYQGAPLTKRTNHISSKSNVRRELGNFAHNTNTIGISCVGAWNSNDFNPTEKQKQQVDKLVFALADVYSIPFKKVFGHGEIQKNRKKQEGTPLAKAIREW